MEEIKMRLLIVDDGHYIVEYIKHLLDWKKFGIDAVETTTNSIKAKEILDQTQIDILITDIRMPEVTGIDLLQHINKKNLRTKSVILSGYSDFEYAQKALRLGAVDYLLKPIDKDQMETTVKKLIKTIDKNDFEIIQDIAENEKDTELPKNNIINIIQAYVDDHLDNNLSLDDLGRLVYLHPVYLSKLYKQETGENLSNYISRKRLEKASRLLTDSNLHVNDISVLVGYKKTQYFIKLFKDQYGDTPQQYRRKQIRKG
jgi:two-component system, response regulator YesN